MNDPVSTGKSPQRHQSEAAGQDAGNDEDIRFTRCPHCQAVFRVGKSKLDARQGKVRCGACREVFNALTHQVIRNHQGLFEPADRAESVENPVTEKFHTGDNQNDDEAIDSNQSTSFEESPNHEPAQRQVDSPEQDEDLEANRKAPVFTEMYAPANPAGNTSTVKDPGFGQRREPRLDFVEEDAQASETPVEEDIEPDTPESAVSEQNWFSVDPDPLLDHNPFAVKRQNETEERDTREEPTMVVTQAASGQLSMQGVDQYIRDRKNPLVTIVWTLVAIGFVFLLGFQVKYYLVERFAADDRYRPYLSGFCRIAGCQLPPRRDTYRFTITNTRIDLHPSEPGALRITVKLLNQARFSQPYPALQLTLTDRLGRVVGRRSFDPTLYLHNEQSDLLDSGELETVMFDLAHPHEKAVGFVVDIVHAPGTV